VTLDEIRIHIDRIDSQLLSLLSERADLVHEVGVVKKRDGLQIYAPEREDALLRKLVTMNQGRLPERSIRAIYREIMSAALALEDDMKIAYLGPEGTWTHQAAIKKFGHSVEYLPQPNFADVFDQVARRSRLSSPYLRSDSSPHREQPLSFYSSGRNQDPLLTPSSLWSVQELDLTQFP